MNTLKRPGASTADLIAVQQMWRVTLSDDYKTFLQTQDGWLDGPGSWDIFGTPELLGEETRWTDQLLSDLQLNGVLDEMGLDQVLFFPLACILETTIDLLVVQVIDGVFSGPILHFAGYYVESFENFDTFMTRMLSFDNT